MLLSDSMTFTLVSQKSKIFSFLARKLLKDIRFPEVCGKVCRALPYDRDSKKYDSKGSIFVKGLNREWTHKDLYECFKNFGDITSVKISLSENHLSRGYGFVLFSREEFAQRAIECV